MTHAASNHAIVEKWGEAGKAGFQMVPDVLFKYQGALQLNPTEIVVLLNICMHWWYRERLPRLRSSTIARRMNVDARTVQRALKRLQQRELIRRIPRRHLDQVTPSNIPPTEWDLTGLVVRLERLAKSDPAYRHRTGLATSERMGASRMLEETEDDFGDFDDVDEVTTD